jgi:adenylylsulfate kinase
MNRVSHKRHIAKTISWRLVGTLDTLILGWILTGSFKLGAAIGGTEIFSKLLLYYLHERIWYNVRIFDTNTSRIRHILKTITWRFIGTLDTMAMGWIISGNSIIGVKIGGFELLTKMLLYYFHERIWYRSKFGISEIQELDKKAEQIHVFKQVFQVSKQDRNQNIGHQSFMILLTGLSGSGKSTVANQLEYKLFQNGISTYSLDGDNLRIGLNKGLGFSEEDRTENLRRIAEVGKMMVEAGLVTMGAFVSPMKADRAMIKSIVGVDNFVEIYINTPLEICEKRDVKGLYAKARRGEISNFTGISAPYEKPENPDLTLDTSVLSVDEAVEQIYTYLLPKLKKIHE